MAEMKVWGEVRKIPVKTAGIRVHVSEGKQKLGRLLIRGGTVCWYDKNDKKSCLELTWPQLIAKIKR